MRDLEIMIKTQNIAFAIYEDNKWYFLDENLQKISKDKLKNRKICVILPDKWFFFFQTEIVPSRKAYNIVNAYAKSTFSLGVFNVDFLRTSNPIIGYIFHGNIEKVKEILDIASIITTFFTITLFSERKPFIYLNNSTVAICKNGKIEAYFKGDLDAIKNRIDNMKDYNIIDIKKDKEKLIRDLLTLIKQKKEKNIKLYIFKKDQYNLLNKYLPLIISICFILILTFLGNFLKYNAYCKQEEILKKDLQKIYEKAFQGKKYQDPYGMLLYLAKKYENSQRTSWRPLEIIYSLSRYKKSSLEINYLSYDSKNGLKIKGIVKDYKTLLDFISDINKSLQIDAKIEETKNKNGFLEFIIVALTE